MSYVWELNCCRKGVPLYGETKSRFGFIAKKQLEGLYGKLNNIKFAYSYKQK